jgi:hypothetical protein
MIPPGTANRPAVFADGGSSFAGFLCGFVRTSRARRVAHIDAWISESRSKKSCISSVEQYSSLTNSTKLNISRFVLAPLLIGAVLTLKLHRRIAKNFGHYEESQGIQRTAPI